MKVKSEREVTQSCPTLSMDCSLPGSEPEIPVAPGVEHYVLDTSLDEVYFALQ